jgi:hypothetical protein
MDSAARSAASRRRRVARRIIAAELARHARRRIDMTTAELFRDDATLRECSARLFACDERAARLQRA